MMRLRLVLVGDSDIAHWPAGFYPTIQDCDEKDIQITVSGHSGATLKETLHHLRKLVTAHPAEYSDHDHNQQQQQQQKQDQVQQYHQLIVVACAGENDIGEGISLDSSVSALEKFIEIVFESKDGSMGMTTNNRHLIFLGPKFEPWLNDNPSYKKKYAKMSRSFKRCCQSSFYANNIHFIDCITMFCGDTANVPGAVLGGKGRAEYKYFISDHLHLSDHGYKIWKEVVENCIKENITTII